MNPIQNAKRYPRISMFFHWIVLIFIVLAYLFIYIRGIFGKASFFHGFAVQTHVFLGLLVLLFLIFRVIPFLFTSMPPIVPETAQWQQKLAKGMFIILWILMLVIPITGYLYFNSKGHSVSFLGLSLPDILSSGSVFYKPVKFIHKGASYLFIVLICLHALAALSHHILRKDNALLLMIPHSLSKRYRFFQR